MNESAADKALRVVRMLERAQPYDLTLHRLAGDASDRSYFRATYGAFGKKRTVVMMVLAAPDSRLKSEEVTLYHDESGELPFLNIHRFLESIGAPVPRVLLADMETGVLLLEDLGDTLLADIVAQGDRETTTRLYMRALDQLVYLQECGTARLTDRCVAAQQRFSKELFYWEFHHFIEYGIEARRGPMPEGPRRELDDVCGRWAARLAELPAVFVHRDYHSRNLMVQADRVVMIDFQDALTGPATYDLASLLRDSYVDLGWELVDKLVEYYLAAWTRRTGENPDRPTFAANLWATALQRNLKAAGRFVYLERVKGKPGYEKDIPRTISYLRGYRERAPELAELIDPLIPWVPELEL